MALAVTAVDSPPGVKTGGSKWSSRPENMADMLCFLSGDIVMTSGRSFRFIMTQWGVYRHGIYGRAAGHCTFAALHSRWLGRCDDCSGGVDVVDEHMSMS